MELIKVANMLIEKIKKDYHNDVSIVALCGSYIYNDTHDKSDLDFYYIPKTNRGYEMSKSFILEDIGFDFWGMSWERAESLAKYNGTNTSIITEAKIIYYGSQEDLDRFNSLRILGDKITDEEFHQKANEQIMVCQDYYFKMIESKNNFSLVKQNAIDILYYSAFSIALLNRNSIKRGGRHLLKEVLAMKLVPNDYENMYMSIIQSNDVENIINVSKNLIVNLRSLLQSKIKPNKNNLIQGYYEELKSIYNKLIHECEMKNIQGIMLAIARINGDVSSFVEEAGFSYSQFPDLLLISQEQDIDKLICAINKHENLLIELLKKEQIPIINYKSLDELHSHLN